MLDHTSLASLAAALGGLFWRDLERHHPGIDSLHLQPAVAAAWKQRLLTKTRRVTGPNGEIREVLEPRAAGLHSMGEVRAFYLDIAQWAMEDPSRWAPWAAPCPIRPEDLAHQKTLRARKSRTDNAPGNGCPCCLSWSPTCTPRRLTARPAAHRYSHRGTDRIIASQPHPIHPTQHR
jgi:hypothetical protein